MGTFDVAAATMSDTVRVLVDDLATDAAASLSEARGSAAAAKQASLAASVVIALICAVGGASVVSSLMRQVSAFSEAASLIARMVKPVANTRFLGILAGRSIACWSR